VPVAGPLTEVIYEYAPTCTNNTRLDGDTLCGAAVSGCQPVGTGLISYWRWSVPVYVATGKIVPPNDWMRLPGSVCLGPDKVGLPSIAAITGIVNRDFKDLVVLKGAARVKPSGTTLVNYATEFSTPAGKYVLPAVTILGRRVVVTASPERYDWHFGDGTEALDAGSGQDRPVLHTYEKPGSVGRTS
jgi:hypothetical protein